VNAPRHAKRINFDNICEIIQTSDGFSRHLRDILLAYKVAKMTQEGRLIFFNIFFTNREPTLEKCRNPHIHRRLSSMM
jgi:hypothetical protein